MKEPVEVWGVYPAGGKGERLFPISTPECPKPFCEINDGSGNTFIQATQNRANLVGVAPEHAVVITTNPIQTKLTKEQLMPLGVLEENILEIDPNHDYAGAMCVAGEYVYQRSKKATILNMPADQWVDANEDYVETLTLGIENASAGNPTIVAIDYEGIDDFGTICGCGHTIYVDDGKSRCYRVIGFEEKPNEARARELIALKSSALNTGINIWRAEDIHRICQERGDLLRNPLSTDGLMKMFGNRLSVVKGKFKWLDCGSLDSYHRVSLKTDEHNNSVFGDVEAHGCDDSLLAAIGKEYALDVVGAEKTAIVYNEVGGKPVVVIAKLEKSQNVRTLAECFAQNGNFLNEDFAYIARNNTVTKTALSAQIACGFVGVSDYIVEPKKVDGRKVISIRPQLAAVSY